MPTDSRLTPEARVTLQDLLEPALRELLDDPADFGGEEEIREWWVQVEGLCSEAGVRALRELARDLANPTEWKRLVGILGDLIPKQGDLERGTPL